MAERSWLALFLTLALGGALADQVSKYAVFHRLYAASRPVTLDGARQGERVVLPGVFELLAQFTPDRETGTGPRARLRTLGGNALPAVNHGALFGFLRHHESLANGLFAAISLIAACAITWWAGRPSVRHDRGLVFALGLILAGTLGNLFDRLVFDGVRDFLHWHYHDAFDWPVFNLADCFLVVGALLLLAQAFLAKSHAAQPAATLADSPPVPEEIAQPG